MNVSFEIPQDMEQQLRSEGVDPNRDAKQVYLLEQYRQARITHRQLEEVLGLSFHETEQILKQRGMGQDLDTEAFGAERDLLRNVRPH